MTPTHEDIIQLSKRARGILRNPCLAPSVHRNAANHIRNTAGAKLSIAVVDAAKVRASAQAWMNGETGLEPTRPLEAIAADIGELMAETVFQGIEGLERDHRAFRERFGIGSAQ
jgi:hypothetical protein